MQETQGHGEDSGRGRRNVLSKKEVFLLETRRADPTKKGTVSTEKYIPWAVGRGAARGTFDEDRQWRVRQVVEVGDNDNT